MSKKVLFIIMPEMFQDFEFGEPYKCFKEKGYTIDIAGFKKGIAKGAFGLEINANLLLDKLSEQELSTYDVLVIPGGPGSTKYLWGNKKIQEIILEFYKNKKIIASICYAVITLVQAGILTDKKATVFPTNESKGIFKDNKVTFVDKGVVVLPDEKIITAQGPTYAKEFGNKIVELLES
jgi:protease I